MDNFFQHKSYIYSLINGTGYGFYVAIEWGLVRLSSILCGRFVQAKHVLHDIFDVRFGGIF